MPEQFLESLGGRLTRRVRIEREEDAGATRQGCRDALGALRAERGASGHAPLGERQPVEQSLGEHRPRRCGAKLPGPEQGLGTGQRLEPGRTLRLHGTSGEPPDTPAGNQIGDDHHPSEPLPVLGEQPRSLQALRGEPGSSEVGAQPAARRVAEAEAGCRFRADAPRAQVRLRYEAAPQPAGVEPGGCSQQGGIGRWRNGAPGRGRRPRTKNGGGGGRPNAAVQTPNRLREVQALDATHEI